MYLNVPLVSDSQPEAILHFFRQTNLTKRFNKKNKNELQTFFHTLANTMNLYKSYLEWVWSFFKSLLRNGRLQHTSVW